MNETQLACIEEFDHSVLFFVPDNLTVLLKRIEDETGNFVPDLSSAKSRKEIASLAFKVARSKTFIDTIGAELVSKKKEEIASYTEGIKKIEAERKRAKEFLDDLKKRIREPLDKYEEEQENLKNAEKAAAQYLLDWDEAHKDNELFDERAILQKREEELKKKEEELLNKVSDEKKMSDMRVKLTAEVCEIFGGRVLKSMSGFEDPSPDVVGSDRGGSIIDDIKRVEEITLERKKEVNKAILEDLLKLGFEQRSATFLIVKIARGEIENLKITY